MIFVVSALQNLMNGKEKSVAMRNERYQKK